MTFFRIKKIKGNDYVYLVENEWKGNTSRQKVIGYLGRAYRLEVKQDMQFLEFHKIGDIGSYVNDKSIQNIIFDLVEWEIYRHSPSNGGFAVDIEAMKVRKKNKDVVLLMNGGFMSGLTLANLLKFRKESEEQDANRLARAFVEAGIKIPEEIFIGLFTKLYKQQEEN
jgi:hypothetical protein